MASTMYSRSIGLPPLDALHHSGDEAAFWVGHGSKWAAGPMSWPGHPAVPP